MRRRKQKDIDLDLVHGLAAGTYDAAYVGGDWHQNLKKRIKAGQPVTEEYEEAFIIGFIGDLEDRPTDFDEYVNAVARFGKRLQELGRNVSWFTAEAVRAAAPPEVSDEYYDEEESGIRENPNMIQRLGPDWRGVADLPWRVATHESGWLMYWTPISPARAGRLAGRAYMQVPRPGHEVKLDDLPHETAIWLENRGGKYELKIV
jgi:hypothetical protein